MSPPFPYLKFAHLVLGTKCLGCRGWVRDSVLCPDCGRFPAIEFPFCSTCGEPLSYPAAFCGFCPSRLPEGISSLRSQYLFNSPTRSLLHQIKFRRFQRILELFRPGLSDEFIEKLPSPTVLIAIPLSRTGHWRRGFNPSEVLCQMLSRAHGLTVLQNGLKKPRATLPQSSLHGEARLKNLKNGFVWKKRGRAPDSVLIIDDMTTTGATLSEAAKVLKKNGATWIGAWTLLRTP